MTTSPLVISRVRLWGADSTQNTTSLVDLSIDDGKVVAIAPSGCLPSDLRRPEEVIDLDGRWLMPGLVDKHVHFTLWSQHRNRVNVAGLGSAAAVVEAVRLALVDLKNSHRGASVPLVAMGYQDALWPDAPTAEALDWAAARVGQLHRPIVLISHDLHSVWISTAAATRYGTRAGLLREGEAFDLENALKAEEATDTRAGEALVTHAAAEASARGVTGIMDLEMADNPTVWASRVRAGLRSLRVEAGVYPQHLDEVLARGERTGKRLPGTEGLVSVGPLKVFADGALNTRTAWCFEEYPHTRSFGYSAQARGDLQKILADARDVGFEVALHAIGDRAVASALDAFEHTGAKGSIEHAQLIRTEDIPRFAALGIAAGIHPEHALDDREVSDALWVGRTDRAFPYRALADAGAALCLGSDAPVAPLDPWFGISAAVHRTRDAQPAWEPNNALTIDQALRASWAVPSVSVGMLADLVAVDADPAALTAADLRAMPVALTVTAGHVTHRAI